MPAPAHSIDAVRTLKIPAGRVVQVERSDHPIMGLPQGDPITGLPPRTMVSVILHPAPGSVIRVEIWLPEAHNWNGRFVGLGSGGSAGFISPHSLSQHLVTGNAVAFTDMGTAPHSDTGIGNPEVWKDFGFRATHLMTVTAKQVIAAFYGKPQNFSYFLGGSTGGQQAMQEAQRHPDDYDGIFANVPAHCRTPLHAYFMWNDQIWKTCPFSESQDRSVMAAGLEVMGAREIPAFAGRVISDVRVTPADIDAVIRNARARDASLTDNHTRALAKILDGPRHSRTGERVFNGVPLGSSLAQAHGNLYVFQWVFGRDLVWEAIDWDHDLGQYSSTLGPYLDAENPDLSRFRAHGGKLIMVTGTADSVVPAHATVDYYEHVAEQMGSIDKTREFARLFVIPGMTHGSGPRLTDTFALLKAWREEGKTPEFLDAHYPAAGIHPELDVPLYAYPQKTGWSADGGFAAVAGPRGGIERVAARFRHPAAE
jgi:feruloyl esterase